VEDLLGEGNLGRAKFLDITGLVAKAKKSKNKEFFKTVRQNDVFRIGVGAKMSPENRFSFFVEVLVCLCVDDREFDISKMEERLGFLKRLKQRGYLLTSQDGCVVTCEIVIPPEKLSSECEEVGSLSAVSSGDKAFCNSIMGPFRV
jgi:hypothetical protein